MKQLLLLVTLLALMAQGIIAQNVSKKNFKRDILKYPILPVENMEKVNFSIYYPDPSITLDTIRGYAGTMKILNGGVSLFGKMSGYSYRPMTLVDQDWDHTLEIAYGNPSTPYKKVETRVVTNLLGDEVTRYYYDIKVDLPVVTKFSDQQGNILGMWKGAKEVRLTFGNEKITTRKDTEEGETVSVDFNIYHSEEDLKKGFEEKGGEAINYRKAMLTHLTGSIDHFYYLVYFYDRVHKYSISSGRSNNYDYTELDNARDEAIRILEEGDPKDLTRVMANWEKYIEKADLSNKKAMINPKIANGLHRNLALAHMYRNEFEEALEHANEHSHITKNVASSGSKFNSTPGQLRRLINRRKKAHAVNGHLTLKPEKNTAYDFKKTIGRRDRNDKFDFFFTADKIAQFQSEYNTFHNIQPAKKKVAPEPAKPIPKTYAERAAAANATQGGILFLDPITDAALVGKELPSDILQITNLFLLNLTSMEFSSIPENIGVLTNLGRLNLSNNKLTTLPESIGNLTKLKMLNLKNNNLTTIPASIKNCTKLKTIHLSGNNISDAEMAKIKGWLPAKCKVK